MSMATRDGGGQVRAGPGVVRAGELLLLWDTFQVGDSGLDSIRGCVLAIDLGTSGPKVAVVSAEGRIVSQGRAHVSTRYLPGDGAEQDPEEIWQAVLSAAGEALAAVARGDIEAILCSSHFGSVVPVDKAGRPVMNLMVWLDKRGATPRLKKLAGYPRGADGPWQMLQWVRRHGGAPIGTGDDTLAKLRWIKYARPDVYARTAAFLEPMDFLAMRLTGRVVANQCTAYPFLLMDNRRLNHTAYDPALVGYSGIDGEKLPPLVGIEEVVGTLLPEVAESLGLSPKVKVFAGVNDSQAGAMGTCAFTGTHASMPIGTTGCLTTHLNVKRTDILKSVLSYPSPVPKTYFMLAENGVAGAALEHFLSAYVYPADAFGESGEADRFAALDAAVAESAPGAGGAMFLPWMNGSFAPLAEPRMRGGLINLGMKTTRHDLARAVLEGVAMNLRWLRGAAETFAGRRFSHFLFHGGGAQSDTWAQILADVLGAPVHQVAMPRHMTCLGDGFLALERLGHLSYADMPGLVPIRRVYDPRATPGALYDSLYPQFLQAFKRNRPIFRALNAYGGAVNDAPEERI